MRTPRLALLLALALAALGVAACGGGSGDGSRDAEATLRATFGPGKPVRSGRLELGLDLDLRGIASLQGPVRLSLRGPFASQGAGKLPHFAFDLALQAGGRDVSVGAVSAPGKGFLTIEGVAFDLGDELYASFRKGYERSAARDSGKQRPAGALDALGIEPMAWLRDPRDEGTEDVGGVEARHVAAGIDVPRLLDDLDRLLARGQSVTGGGAGSVPERLSAEQRRQVERSVEGAKVDVWSGEDDGTLRRLRLAVELAVPEDVRGQVGGLEGGTITLDLKIAELNEPQRITAPASARPLKELRSALGTLLGSGDRGAGGDDAGSGAAATSEYDACLAAAGTEVSRIQACGDLLGR